MNNNDPIASLKAQTKHIFKYSIAIFIITFGISIYLIEFSMNSLITMFLYSLMLSLTIFQFWKENANKANITIYNDRIELDDGKFYWTKIKQVKFQREMKQNSKDFYSKCPSILLYLDSGSIITTQIPSPPAYDSVGVFCKGLINISALTDVLFYTEHQLEYEKLSLLVEKRENVVLEESKVLINDNKYN